MRWDPMRTLHYTTKSNFLASDGMKNQTKKEEMNEKYARWRMRYTLGCTNATLCKIAHNIFCTLFFLLLVLLSLPTLYSMDMKCEKRWKRKYSNRILQLSAITSKRIRKVQCRWRSVECEMRNSGSSSGSTRFTYNSYTYNGRSHSPHTKHPQANKCMFITISLSSAVLCSCFHVVRASLQSQFTRHLWCVKELSV